MRQKQDQQATPSGIGRRFYCIADNDDGTVDVYLSPVVFSYETDVGIREYDIQVHVIRGIEPWPEMEEDIRRRYDSWCKSAEVIDL